MSHKFPSTAWCNAYKDALNDNPAYRQAGKGWTYGPVAMVVQANPSIGIANDVAMLLDVHEGQCRSANYFEDKDSIKDAPFVIIAEYNRWKEVLEGKIDPIRAMMEGKLKLTKGHLPTIIRFVEASRQLVASASRVSTEFPA